MNKDVNSQTYPFPFEYPGDLNKSAPRNRSGVDTLFRTNEACPPFWSSYCTEKNCVRSLGTSKCIRRKWISRRINCATSHQFMLIINFQIRIFDDDIENFDGFGDDFWTDAVAAEDANCFFRHCCGGREWVWRRENDS